MIKYFLPIVLGFIYISANSYSQIVIQDRTKPLATGRMFDNYKEFPIGDFQIGNFVVLDSSTILGADSGNGWIYRSTDAGKSWEISFKNPSSTPEDPYSSRLFDMTKLTDRSFITVGGKGRIIRTTDAGDSWHVDSTGFTTPLQYVDNLDSSHMVLGRLPNGSLLHSEDSGNHWDTLFIPLDLIPSHFGIVNLVYVSTGTIVVQYGFKEQNIQLKTTDLGKTWLKTDLSELRILTGMLFKYGNDTLIAIRYSPISNNTNDPKTYDAVIRSTDLGDSWHYLINGGAAPYWGLSTFTSKDKNSAVITGGEGKVYITTNGGENWIRENSPFQQLVELRKVSYAQPHFVNKNLLYTRFINSESNNFVHVTLFDTPQIVSSIDDINTLDLTISPNPAINTISVKSTAVGGEITLRNSMGETLLNTKHHQFESLINTQSMVSGVYSLEITYNQIKQKDFFIVIH